MTTDDLIQDLGKNVDADELLQSFLIDVPREYTEAERAVKKELSALRKMRRILIELNHIKKEEKPRSIKPCEKAKEEAMQLLRSGAISIVDKKDRHTFKRKLKDNDEDDLCAQKPKKHTLKEKSALYSNFTRGPKLFPPYSDDRRVKPASVDEVKPLISGDGSDRLSPLEAAASKRKQQLISLSDEVENPTPVSSQNDVSESNYSSQLSAQSSEATLYVAYHNVTESFLHEMFEPYGTIARIKIGEQHNHAYVTFTTREMAEKALELDHQMVSNRLLRVNYARRQVQRRRECPRNMRPFSPTSIFGHPNRRPPFSHDAPMSKDSQTTPSSDEPPRDLVTYEDLYDNE